MLVLMFSLAILYFQVLNTCEKKKLLMAERRQKKEKGGGGLWCPRNGKQLGKNRLFRRDLSHSALAL